MKSQIDISTRGDGSYGAVARGRRSARGRLYVSGVHVVVWMFRVRRFLVFVVFLYFVQNFVFFFFSYCCLFVCCCFYCLNIIFGVYIYLFNPFMPSYRALVMRPSCPRAATGPLAPFVRGRSSLLGRFGAARGLTVVSRPGAAGCCYNHGRCMHVFSLFLLSFYDISAAAAFH